ncbi:MAG: BspA family leucine-rich repeat surface protein [Clostridia bacterium]|nr:BspA family leucine-rich repeat surface protein [Clostridia bacterium]
MKNTKKIISIIIGLIMLIALFPMNVFAESTPPAKDTISLKKYSYTDLSIKAKSITFVKTLPEGVSKVKDDISEDSAGNIALYKLNDSEDYYIYNTAGNKIYAPVDSFGMFSNHSQIEKLDFGSNIFDTSYVTHMGDMFASFGASSENLTLDLSSFDTSKVTTMEGMFYESKIKSINLSSFNTANVKNMTAMFRDCSNLEILDLSSFDTSKVEKMASMFSLSGKLKTIYVSEKFVTTAIIKTDDPGGNFDGGLRMFAFCEQLKGDKGTTYDSNFINSEYARLDGGKEKPGYFSRKPKEEKPKEEIKEEKKENKKNPTTGI